MLESNLVEGRQDVVEGEPLQFGQSITDPCMSWDDTLPLLQELAAAVRTAPFCRYSCKRTQAR